MAEKDFSVPKALEMGLGEALRRLFVVEERRQRGISHDEVATSSEVDMIYASLDTIKLKLGFDCNMDGVPDTAEIFEKSANTSCCRLMPPETSRKPAPPSTSRKLGKSSSRKKR